MSDASVPFANIKVIQAPVQEWEIIKDPVTITIYCINPSGKLKLWFDRTTKNIIILNHEYNSDMLVTFYNAVICSIIMFGSVCKGGNI